MKKIICLALCLSFLCLQASAVVLPEGKAVVVKPQKEIDSDDLKLGENVKFEVLQSVKVNGETAIKAGTEVVGQVVKRKNNFILGIPGELEISGFKIETDGEPVLLRGSMVDKGEGRYWAHVGWFFMFPLLFVKGGDGKFPANVQYTLYSMEEVRL